MTTPIISPTGSVVSTLASSFNWQQPWGQIFAVPSMSSGITANPTFYVSQAGNGSIVSIAITSKGFVYNTIATGFPSAKSAQYGILAPAGLTYDPSSDTLYVVSSDTNSIVAISNVSTVPANGITVSDGSGSSSGSGYGYGSTSSGSTTLTFSGPAAAQARVVFSGSPLNYPVSSALLYNGDLVVGNTGDNNMVEINPSTGMVVGTTSVDSGNPGAIFGIATEGTSLNTQKVFFKESLLSSSAPASCGFMAEPVGPRQGCSLTLHERAINTRPRLNSPPPAAQDTGGPILPRGMSSEKR